MDAQNVLVAVAPIIGTARTMSAALNIAEALELAIAVIEEEIEEAFKREAEIDARHIRIEVSDHTAKLYGHVHSMHEVSAARAAAASAPGVAAVESHLVAIFDKLGVCSRAAALALLLDAG